MNNAPFDDPGVEAVEAGETAELASPAPAVPPPGVGAAAAEAAGFPAAAKFARKAGRMGGGG